MTNSEKSNSLRSWIETLEAADQLKRITARVDWDEEIGAITRCEHGLGRPGTDF